MSKWEVRTQAATRSKTRRDMTHIIEAPSEAEAIYEARKAHIDRVGWNSSVWVVSARAL